MKHLLRLFFLSLVLGVAISGLLTYQAWAATRATRTIVRQTGLTKPLGTCRALASRIKSAMNVAPMWDKGIAIPLSVLSPVTGMAKSTGIAESAPSFSAGGKTDDYSRTNVQVQGVDEADIVKLDGTYAYHLTKNRLAITRVYPETSVKLESVTDMPVGQSAQDFYVDGDRLVILSNKWEERVYRPVPMLRAQRIMRPWYGRTMTFVDVYDVKDRAHPKKIRTVEFDGSLATSRRISDRVYLVMNAESPWDGQTYWQGSEDLVPAFRDSRGLNKMEPMARCAFIPSFSPEPARQFVAVASVPLSDKGEVKRTVVLGTAQTIFASRENLYIARQDWSVPSVRDSVNPEATERTIIEKFSLGNGVATHIGRGIVPGTLLNQFSMDESDQNLRIATTKGQVWDEANLSTNNLYILDKNMKIRGKIEGMAPGEKIYSVRFMGKRGYLVTFKKVDPLFALDLSNPDKPSILGKLKIPGYSDYLHPMDDTHLIGVGKNAVDAPEQSFAWYQGIKMAVFDVTDPEHPKEMWKTEIGDRGTDSPVLSNHKAFLYDAKKQMLALPVTLAELTPEQKIANDQGNLYGDYTFQGAYVYRLSLEKGFEQLGRISHYADQDVFQKSGYYFDGGDDTIERVQYVGDTLVTFSPNQMQLHGWPALEAKGGVTYPASLRQPGY